MLRPFALVSLFTPFCKGHVARGGLRLADSARHFHTIPSLPNLFSAPALQHAGLHLRLLALHVSPSHPDAYSVLLRQGSARESANQVEWVPGSIRHHAGQDWKLELAEATTDSRLVQEGMLALGKPDEVLATALNGVSLPEELETAAPHWPSKLLDRMRSRFFSGEGRIALDGRWFLGELASSSMHTPILFPQASSRLGLSSVQDAETVAERAADRLAKERSEGETGNTPFLRLLQPAVAAWGRTQRGSGDGGGGDAGAHATRGLQGRLVGEYKSGELAQIGLSLSEGLALAAGTGKLVEAMFSAGTPLGISFAPLVPACTDVPTSSNTLGDGAEIVEVDEDSAAEKAGVRVGMTLALVDETDVRDGVSFERVLRMIDAAIDAERPLRLSFDTAAPIEGLYAVEMELGAIAALDASLAAACGNEPVFAADSDLEVELDVGSALNAMLGGGAFLWREQLPRIFVGDAGSLTCAHVDLMPQLELAHGLTGTKILGVATRDATARLLATHGAARDDVSERELERDQERGRDEQGAAARGLQAEPSTRHLRDGEDVHDDDDVFDDDEGDDDDYDDDDDDDCEAARVPTNRELEPLQESLLSDDDMSMVALRRGDLLCFSSAAMHFASNGADGLNAAMYHGAITAAAVPRLCESALARPEGFRGEYGGHISASQLVFSKELDSAQSASQRWLLDALAGGLGEGARVGKQLVERHRQAAEKMQKALARARKLYTK